MRIGQLAKETGHSVPTLRFYEESGLLVPTARSDGGYRLYESDAVRRVRFIQRAKALGLSLSEIRQLVDNPTTPAEEHARLRHLIAHKLAATRRRQEELASRSSELQGLYVRLLRGGVGGCGHLGDCECWLPTIKEAMTMANEIECCGDLCCPGCACTKDQPCDCPDCPCARASSSALLEAS
jgi:MerR family Zn(II)-responsive transcriptional regulator of zntA